MKGASKESGLPSRASLAAALEPLDRARTLPARAFTDPAVYAREVERLFRSGWLCAGRLDQVAEPGDYLCVDLLDEKLVLVRDEAGEVRVLSRVCRHRAAEVASGRGNARQLVCPYHAWAYHLDGRLAGAPLLERLEGFDVDACRLPQVRSEVWESWIFVNLDGGAEALVPQLAPLSKLLAPYAMADRVVFETSVYDSRFNWKVLVDNFMEAYHHVATHRDTLQSILPAAMSWVPDNEGPWSALMMPAREQEATSGEEPPALVAAVVYPFHLFAPSASSLTWYQLFPERHDCFSLRIHSCFAREGEVDATAARNAHAFVERVHEQDIGACESVWSGLSSPGFESGRLSTLEKAIWQFNRWWAERMAVDASA